jgi:hypothetical protein
MWLIKTEHGYILEEHDGTIVKFFVMACDSKAWCMAENISPIYLTRKSNPATMITYTEATGKTLWWNINQ